MIKKPWLIILTALVVAAVSAKPQAGRPQYALIKKIVLGGEGGWDYLKMSTSTRRLYISRGTHVMVLDIDTYAVIGDIPDTPGVHGIALASKLGRGFTSNGKADTVGIFDLKTLKKIGTVNVGKNPDAILFDPASQRVFAFNGRSHDVTAINATNGAIAGTITLGGKPEFAAYDGTGDVYVNIEDKNEVVVLDSRKLKITARWPLKPCEEPSGMAIDRKNRRLFVGCHNKMMAVVDADKGSVIATPAIGQGVDANAFDQETGLAFSSNGDGTLTIVHEDSPNKFTVVANVPTQKGARTMAVDKKTHRVFLVTTQFGPVPAPTQEQPHPRPPPLPGTFTLLVVGPKTGQK